MLNKKYYSSLELPNLTRLIDLIMDNTGTYTVSYIIVSHIINQLHNMHVVMHACVQHTILSLCCVYARSQIDAYVSARHGLIR